MKCTQTCKILFWFSLVPNPQEPAMTWKNHHNSRAVSSSAGAAIMLLCSSFTENTVIHSITARLRYLHLFSTGMETTLMGLRLQAHGSQGTVQQCSLTTCFWHSAGLSHHHHPTTQQFFHLLVIPKYLPWHCGTNIFLVLLPSETSYSFPTLWLGHPGKAGCLGMKHKWKHFHGHIGV